MMEITFTLCPVSKDVCSSLSVPSSLPTLNSGEVHFHDQIHTLPYQTAVVSLSTHLSPDLSLAWRVWTSTQIVLTENTTCYKNKWCAFKLFAIN